MLHETLGINCMGKYIRSLFGVPGKYLQLQLFGQFFVAISQQKRPRPFCPEICMKSISPTDWLHQGNTKAPGILKLPIVSRNSLDYEWYFVAIIF